LDWDWGWVTLDYKDTPSKPQIFQRSPVHCKETTRREKRRLTDTSIRSKDGARSYNYVETPPPPQTHTRTRTHAHRKSNREIDSKETARRPTSQPPAKPQIRRRAERKEKPDAYLLGIRRLVLLFFIIFIILLLILVIFKILAYSSLYRKRREKLSNSNGSDQSMWGLGVAKSGG